MSISAYVHMLIDQKLITRDIGLEYIAGYEQARFGGSRNDSSPVTMSPFQPQQLQSQSSQRHHNHHHHHNHNHHHPRHHTSSGRQHVRQSSGLNPRHSQQSQSQSQHPNHDPSTASTTGGVSQHLQTIESSVGGGSGNNGNGERENLEEEDYIRFMKVLSWILQELGWDQAAEEAYEEEFRAQERQREAEQQQQQLHQAQYQHQQQQEQEEVYGQPEERELEHATDYYQSDEGGSTMMLQPRRKQQSQLSGDSYFIVGSSQVLETDPQFQQHHQQHPSQQGQGQGQRPGMQSYMFPNEGGGTSQSQNRRMRGASVGVLGSSSHGTGAGIAGSGGGGGSGTFPSAGPRKLSRSGGGNMSTRSLLTMRTMRTATSSLKSWEQRP
jgi:hypothetical protein